MPRRGDVAREGEERISDERQRPPYVPSVKVAIYAILVVRLLGVILNYITDCDETFNFWEPTHYLIYGFGLQTWEYSPTYALRSYAYILPEVMIGRFLSFFFDKATVYYGIRLSLGLLGVGAETYLYSSVAHILRFSHVPQLLLVFLMTSTGLFTASTAFLPSTFSMYMLTIALAAYLDSRPAWAVFAVGLGALLSWPFSAWAAIPLAVALLMQYGLARVVGWGVASFLAIAVPMIAIDAHYYGSALLATWNITWYNVAAPSGGSELYGVEPWNFYFRNGFLNFNFIFVLSLVSPLAPLLSSQFQRVIGVGNRTRYLVVTLPIWFWVGFMSLQPHKEERFLSLVYPLFCVGGAATAAMAFAFIDDLVDCVMRKDGKRKAFGQSPFATALAWVLVAVVVVVSVSRTTALLHGYSAPMPLYHHLFQEELGMGESDRYPVKGQVNVCVGKEWYRFSSNFFLPNKRFQLQFVRSGFTGLLPAPYADVNGTRVIPPHMNDANKEEPTRYIDEAECHYFIDRDDADQAEPHYYNVGSWKTLVDMPFLDASRSPGLTRAYYIPFYSPSKNHYNHYVLLKNTKLTGRKSKADE